MKKEQLHRVAAVLAIVGLYSVSLLHFSSQRTRTAVARAPHARTQASDVSQSDERRDVIVEMTQHAWGAYFAAAAGADELKPVSNSSSNRWGGIGLMPIDSADTLTVLNLHGAYRQAKYLVKNTRLEGVTTPLSVFETIIRHVGGGLSAHALTNETLFLDFAKSTADGLLHAFQGPLSLPAHATIFRGTKRDNVYLDKRYMLAEIGSFQMEFRYLSVLTGDSQYAKLADGVNKFFTDLHQHPDWPQSGEYYERGQPRMPHKGLFPTFVNFKGQFYGAAGYAALMDSFYEYLLKQWIQFGKTDDALLALYEDAVEGLIDHLIRYTDATHYTILGYFGHTYHPSMDHLACFVPGMLVLGVMHGAHDYPGRSASRRYTTDDIIAVAMDLAETCYRLYEDNVNGLAPDVVEFDANGTYAVRKGKNILRPETVESLFYLYRFTKDEKYRDWGWNIARAFNKHCRTPTGFSSVVDVRSEPPQLADSMESFFVAETLKYLYLLFSDDSVLPLDEWVFTTEAHPLPILNRRKRR